GRAVFSDLPLALERVTARSLKKLDEVVKLPLDAQNGPLLRAQVTAAIGAVNAQLRADEQRLKAKSTGDALARLIKIIEGEKRLLDAARQQHRQDQIGEAPEQAKPDDAA